MTRGVTSLPSGTPLAMNISALRQKIKPWMLPIAMIIGILFHEYIHYIAFLSRYLIFIMLLITYCRVKISDFHTGPYIWWLLGCQILGALAAYLVIRPFCEDLAQGIFICIFCPTATAAPVITGMLGGSVSKVATYSLFSHVAVALLAPPLLSYMEPESGITFAGSLISVSVSVLPLILGPLVLAFVMQRFTPKTHSAIATHQGLSFYIWAFALIIVVGNSVSFIMEQPAEKIPEIIMLGAGSLLVCLLLFAVGRKIGGRFGDKISGAQSLGQKNTVLAIWLALSFLNPVVSAAPAAYVAWHNTVNSYQIYRHVRISRHQRICRHERGKKS